MTSPNRSQRHGLRERYVAAITGYWPALDEHTAGALADAVLAVRDAELDVLSEENEQLSAAKARHEDPASRARARAYARPIGRLFGQLRARIRLVIISLCRRGAHGGNWRCWLCDTWNEPSGTACLGCDTDRESAAAPVAERGWELRA